MIKAFVFLFLLFTTTSCAGPKPVTDYTLSKTALEYAKRAGAESLASGWYFKADTMFK